MGVAMKSFDWSALLVFDCATPPTPPDADFTMLDCPPAAPGESAADDDDGFGDAPAMDADVNT